MNTALWIAQILLALMFLMAGIIKATQPKEKLAEKTPYVEDLSDDTVRLIGVLEILGALGLVLPAVTEILPWLTPLAAVGLALTMIGAARTHIRRGENSNVVVNVVILAIAIFTVYGRFFAEPL